MPKLKALLLLAFLPGSLHAHEPSLVVAGRQATIEEALAAPHARDYRLLILREELNRVRATRAEEEVRELLERARAGGAVVFVCERDLKAERLAPADLLPGIVTADASRVWENGAPSPADIRLRTLCS